MKYKQADHAVADGRHVWISSLLYVGLYTIICLLVYSMVTGGAISQNKAMKIVIGIPGVRQ